MSLLCCAASRRRGGAGGTLLGSANRRPSRGVVPPLLMSVALSLQSCQSLGEPRGLVWPRAERLQAEKGLGPRPGSTGLGEPLRGLGQAKGGLSRLLGGLIAVSPAQLPRGAHSRSIPGPPGTSLSGSLWLCLTMTRVQCPQPCSGEEELPFQEGQILKVTDSLSGPASSLLSCLVSGGIVAPGVERSF